MISRRALLTAVVGAPAALAACQSNGPSLSQLAQDVQTIADGVATILPMIQGVQGISASVIAKIQSGIADLKRVATDVTGGTTSTVQSLANDIPSMIAAIAGIKVPSVVTTILNAASALLPVVLSLAGVVLAGPTAPPVMTADQARLVLRGAAAGALR